MSEGDNGKGKGESGSVVQIADRRSSSGATKEPEKPVEVPVGPKDRNAKVKPMVVNRNEIDPFELIENGHGTGGTRDRATLMLRNGLRQMQRGASVSFRQIESLIGQLDARDQALRDFAARPFWRRWFRKPPVLPELMTPQIEDVEARQQPVQEAPKEPEPPTPSDGTVAG